MEPIDYGGALRRSWRLLVALAILGAVIAVLVPAGHTPKAKSALPYQATTIVGTAPNGPISPLNGTVTGQQILFLANINDNKQQVADAAGLDVPSYALSGYLSASIAPVGTGTGVNSGKIGKTTPTQVLLTGRGATSQAAVNLSNVYAVVLESIVADAATAKQSQNPRSSLSSPSSPAGATAFTGYTIITPAQFGTRSGKAKASLSASRKVRGLAGLVIGALVGAAIILLRELLDKRLRNAARAEANFGFPVVVEIPSGTLGAASALPGLAPMVDVIREPGSPGAEAYRMLRVSVMFEGLASLSGPTDPYALGFDASTVGMPRADHPIDAGAVQEIGDRRVVLVASAGTEPSRPYVAANLAAIYAEAGGRVVVISTGEVEAGTNGRHSATMTGEIRPEDIEAHLEPSRLEHVSRLPLSPFMSRSGQLVTRMPAVLDAARQVSDLIIVEVPPLLGVHHAEALVRSVDVVLVVAECRVTTFDQARRAGDLLRRMGAPVLGIVLTGVRGAHLDHRPAALDRPAPAEDERHDEQVVAIGAGVGSSSAPTTDSPA
jgi:Mrp family chromosome partitioning ATPase